MGLVMLLISKLQYLLINLSSLEYTAGRHHVLESAWYSALSILQKCLTAKVHLIKSDSVRIAKYF